MKLLLIKSITFVLCLTILLAQPVQALEFTRGGSVCRYVRGIVGVRNEFFTTYNNKWALIIGVDDFQDKSWNLKYAKKDARDFRDYLVNDACFAANHVRVVTGKSSTNQVIKESLDWLGKVADSRDLAVIYFRTRGTHKKLDPEGKNYLAAADTKSSALTSTAIEMNTFIPLVLKEIHSKGIAVIIDADFSDVVSWGIFPELPPENLLPRDRPLVIVCSAGTNEICWESDEYRNSVFTHALLKALKQQGKFAMLGSTAGSIINEVDKDVNSMRRFRSQSASSVGMHNGPDGETDLMLATPAAYP